MTTRTWWYAKYKFFSLKNRQTRKSGSKLYNNKFGSLLTWMFQQQKEDNVDTLNGTLYCLLHQLILEML